jgi:hypothetical protein
MLKYFYTILLFSFFFSCKPLPEVEVPIELKQLEKEIIKETEFSDNIFRSIPEHEIENCNVNIYIYIYICNDTINGSEECLSNYVKTISNRVNKVLLEKKCYKELRIETSSNNYKNLKDRMHYFKFPIK